jgi:hypothetical protein
MAPDSLDRSDMMALIIDGSGECATDGATTSPQGNRSTGMGATVRGHYRYEI